jgi:hypothetical protein
MRRRTALKHRPCLERLEAKQPLSGGASTVTPINLEAASHVTALRSGEMSVHRRTAGHVSGNQAVPALGAVSGAMRAQRQHTPAARPLAKQPTTGFLLYRITNPTPFNDKLTPPFQQVQVQAEQPIPGQVYNVLYVVVRNGTSQTFDATNGFEVKLPQQTSGLPVLTGDQQWKPGQWMVFYIFSRKYYPLPSQVHSGFEFDLGGARSVAIPGPSGIFLRLTYDPTKFARTLDWIVAHGPGAQGGKGVRLGIPDTALNEMVSAKTRRRDFGGYF